jgi:hypothetical protein
VCSDFAGACWYAAVLIDLADKPHITRRSS